MKGRVNDYHPLEKIIAHLKQRNGRDSIKWINRPHKGAPGKAMNASAWRAISALRWCMPDTALTSPTVSPVIWNHTPSSLFYIPTTST